MSSINCPKCQTRVWDKHLGNLVKNKEVDGVVYCLKCAKKMESIQEFKCEKCKKPITEHSDFCDKCYAENEGLKISIPIYYGDKLADGIIGGFTFADGHKSLIYQCGECGALLEYNTTYNKHKKEKHGAKDSVQFGWADGEPEWKELEIDESQIEKGVVEE